MMDKQLFDRAIGEAPPSTVDVDGIIARERRAARFRGMANPWVATAAGVVALTFATATAILPFGPDGGALNWGNPPPTSQPTSQPACPTPPTEPMTAAQTRLTEVLNRLVRTQLPAGADLVPSPHSQAPDGIQRAALEVYYVPEEKWWKSLCKERGYFLARANVSRGQEQGNIWASMDTGPFPPGDAGHECAERRPEYACELSTGPNGAIVTAHKEVVDTGATVYNVAVAQPDGTRLNLVAENVSGSVKSGSGPQSPAPPLTLEQLVAIGLDPGLTLYP